jgi:hypothetical protein
MALALIEQGQDQNFDAAPLQLTLEQRRHHMWRDYIYTSAKRDASGLAVQWSRPQLQRT